MRIPEQLFHIEKSMLGSDLIFPFHLYVHNPQSGNYNLFLTANSPLDDDKKSFIDIIQNKGGSLAVDKNQKRTFLSSTQLTEADIPSLRKRELSEIEIKRLEKIKENASLDENQTDEGTSGTNSKYDLKSGLSNCIANNSFLPMIISARREIEVFELNKSHTVSLAAFLAEDLLNEDNTINRIVALSYYFTKNMNMNEQETLADITCAAFFAHLGYTQLDHSLSHVPEIEMSQKNKDKLKKHPGYSHHMLLKSGIEISERCKNIIFQHHERFDGSGYPRQKHSDFIDILALILGSISHIIEYSEGKITGTPVPLTSVIHRLKNKTISAGLEFEFGDKIYDNIVNIIELNSINEAA